MGLGTCGLGWGCLLWVGMGLYLSSTPPSLVDFLSQGMADGPGAFLGAGWSRVGVQRLDPSPTTSPLLSCSIEGEYVPVEGDEVTYKVCPIPPKNQKFQAVEVVLTNLAPHTKHETWSGQIIGS